MRQHFYAPKFADPLADLAQHDRRITQTLRGLVLKLQTNPEFGSRLDEDPRRWFVAMPDVIERAFGILYTFDDTRVVLLSIWIS